MSSKVYAGIGSRQTPDHILGVMTDLARVLREEGWWLRSGHAEGADQAFEAGAGGHADVYLPWASFNAGVPLRANSVAYAPTDAAHDVAALHHPIWRTLPGSVRMLHARNVHQVLGWQLDEPARFVVCWTPDGSLDGRGPNSGGTGQALRVAAAHGIEVFNLRFDLHLERITRYLENWALAPS